MNESPCVYRIFADWGDLLYVGQTVDRWDRLEAHRAGLGNAWAWWPWPGERTVEDLFASGRILFEDFPDRDSAMLAERRAIWKENPLGNLVARKLEPGERCPECGEDYTRFALERASVAKHLRACIARKERERAARTCGECGEEFVAVYSLRFHEAISHPIA